MTTQEYLNKIAEFMTEKYGVPYVIKCFNYPVEMVGYGTHSDEPVERYEPKLEGVIGVSRVDFDAEHMFQGYLCWAFQYPEFYNTGKFVKCFGPEKDLNFEKVLASEFDPENHHFYGLLEDFSIESKRK